MLYLYRYNIFPYKFPVIILKLSLLGKDKVKLSLIGLFIAYLLLTIFKGQLLWELPCSWFNLKNTNSLFLEDIFVKRYKFLSFSSILRASLTIKKKKKRENWAPPKQDWEVTASHVITRRRRNKKTHRKLTRKSTKIKCVY